MVLGESGVAIAVAPGLRKHAIAFEFAIVGKDLRRVVVVERIIAVEVEPVLSVIDIECRAQFFTPSVTCFDSVRSFRLRYSPRTRSRASSNESGHGSSNVEPGFTG